MTNRMKSTTRFVVKPIAKQYHRTSNGSARAGSTAVDQRQFDSATGRGSANFFSMMTHPTLLRQRNGFNVKTEPEI
jgi:hypothetical protein